ncbi:MAG: DUF2066 domain-containing protein [Alphaproteobacteria bacterium]|nr:DUF2066 domain-containing protein [Alphaproteobacteria bacterium]
MCRPDRELHAPAHRPDVRADATVTGTDMRQCPWSFVQTLREVLAKSSGDPRLRDDPRPMQLAVHADRFIACFDHVDMMAAVSLHDEQGTSDRPHELTIYFIPAKIDILLAQFSDKPVRGKRLVVVPILLGTDGKAAALCIERRNLGGRGATGSFATAANQFGMKLRIPNDTQLLAWSVSVGHSLAAAAGER